MANAPTQIPESRGALIALMVVSLIAVAALALAIVSVALMLRRAGSNHWQERSGARARTAAVLSPATSAGRRARSLPVGATVLLTNHLRKGQMK